MEEMMAQPGAPEKWADSIEGYREQLGLPLYLRLSTKNPDFWNVGDTYEVYVKEGDGDFQKAHEAMCMSASEAGSVSEIPDEVLAMVTETASRSEAVEIIEDALREDETIFIVVMMRVDKVKDFVVGGIDNITSGDTTRETAIKEEYV